MKPIVEKLADTTVVVIPGASLVAGNLSGFKREMKSLVNEPNRVLVDLSQVHFIDSAACGALLQFHQQLAARGGRLVVCCATHSVRALFELVRIQRVLEVYPSRERALQALQD